MRNFTLFLMTLVFAAMPAWSEPIDMATSQSIAIDFFTNVSGCDTQIEPASSGSGLPVLLHAETSRTNLSKHVYYIYGSSYGHVIVAGDDRAGQILGYGYNGLNMSNIPCGMQFLLDMYKEQIDYLLEHPGLVVEQSALNTPMLTTTSVSPLLNAKWDQDMPFNNQCPKYDDCYCLTGCSCTSLCQVMYYWRYPTEEMPSLTNYRTKGLGIEVPALPATTFDWANMINSYSGNYSAAQGDAVAELMRYVGQAEEMNYSPYSSTASVDYILKAAKSLNYSNARELLKINYKTKWDSIIQAELRAKRPIVYAGWNSIGPGAHAFNIDGYNLTNKPYYHMNFGWSGNGDGYYLLDAITPTDDYNFSHKHMMIVGLESPDGVPDYSESSPNITVAPTELDFGKVLIGNIERKVFRVTGSDLKGPLMLSLNVTRPVASSFSISRTTISAQQAAAGVFVTVTYNPNELGEDGGHIVISGGGAESQSVSLKGTAVLPIITVTPNELYFEALAGQTVTKSFTVNGNDLSCDLTLTLNDETNSFSIDRNSITVEEAAEGARVNVTFNPSESGTSSASVTITGGGAEEKTIMLSGTVLESPVIRVDVSELEFEPTYTGYGTSRTITIMGAVNENIELSWWRNRSGSFGLSKTTITPQEAAAGAEVTIYFNPSWSSPTSANLEIKSEGAETVTIHVTGTKIKSDGYITAWPTNLSFETEVGEPVTKTFRLHYSKSNGNDAIMISNVGADDESGSSNGDSYNCSLRKVATILKRKVPTILKDSITFKFDSTKLVKDFTPIFALNRINLLITGDDGFKVTPNNVSISEATNGYDVTVTYNPNSAGNHEAVITITLTRGSAKPMTVKLHGTATSNRFNAPRGDVNSTGTVDISDVTHLLNLLLNATEQPECADVNGDDQVNISDVTCLIDLLLNDNTK